MAGLNDGCTPKQLLFGELLRRRPFHGVKKKWRDEVEGDFMPLVLGIGDFSCARIVPLFCATMSIVMEHISDHCLRSYLCC